MLLLNKKGGKEMKKSLLVFANIAKKSAENALKRDANTTTCSAIYQPKAPIELKKFSKFDK